MNSKNNLFVRQLDSLTIASLISKIRSANLRCANLKLFVYFAISILIGTIFFSSYALAATFSGTSSSYGSTTYQQRASYSTYYTSSQIDTYWPILGDNGNCEARQDIMLQVAPAGCQPTVVRSDLLAEQNVPVFCQVDSLKINPLVDIEQIQNIRFTGDYPPEIVGAGFHPARAALRTQDKLLGSPLLNNIGYVVVVLKQQPDESKLPDFVNVTLNAQIDYTIGNAYGIGKSEFILEPVADSEWETEKLKNSFWNGRYFVRLEEADSNFATVSVYEGDRKISSQRVEKGKTSNEIFVPGLYCRAGLQIQYDGFVSANTKARIEVGSGDGVDSFDVYRGSTFLDGRCSVGRIDIDDNKETGKVEISCRGKTVKLELKPRAAELFSSFEGKIPAKKDDGSYEIDLSSLTDAQKKGKYILDKDGKLLEMPSSGAQIILINTDGSYNEGAVKSKNKEWLQQLYNSLKEYKKRKATDPSYEIGTFINKNVTGETKKWFDAAIADFEQVADDYPSEKDTSSSEKYGEKALREGIELARKMGMDSVQARLINEYLKIYPAGGMASSYNERLNNLYKIDSSLSGDVVEFDDKARTIRLVSLDEPSEKANAIFLIDNKKVTLEQNERKNASNIEFNLESIDAEKVQVNTRCLEGANKSKTQRFTFQLDRKSEKVCDGVEVSLDEINAKEVAKIRLLPSAKSSGPEGETNFTVNIGIEKRLIKLNPDKTADKIEELNKTIQKWEDISEKLGKVVTGLKGACFATATLLTFKNFFSGLSGEAIARQKVMSGDNGWTVRCKEMVAKGEKGYGSLDACYTGEASKIDGDVAAYTAAMNKVNAKIQSIQSKPEYQTSSSLWGNSVDADKVREAVAAEARAEYGSKTIDMGRYEWIENGQKLDSVSVDKIVSDTNVQKNLVSTSDLRDIMLYSELQDSSGLSAEQKDNLKLRAGEAAGRVNSNMRLQDAFDTAKLAKGEGYGSPLLVGGGSGQERVADVVPLRTDIKEKLGFTGDATHIATVVAGSSLITDKAGRAIPGAPTEFKEGTYILGLKESDVKKGIYTITEVKRKDGASVDGSVAQFSNAYGIGNIRDTEMVDYSNEIISSDRVCRYYETEPYKGMPAILPFDYKQGWYAATRQQLPVGGGIGAFDASGRVTSFWLCNVGENGRIEFETGLGDDLCQQVNMNTGQPNNMFPGLSESEARTLITKATRAVEDGARQYGGKFITVNGERCEVGNPAVGVAGSSCQDFMSPKDCHLMFNVCDPVICPASRCNFGGTYQVADVIQTGIVGSIFLCLPNIKEGIAMPVCLTGIQAGIDGLISIMRNYRDCLQENLDTGQMVGVCDQIYSIYLCEFLWRQVAPFVAVLIPKMIEMAYGQGTRGGAEYLTVMSSWQNAQKSVQQFTQSYAVNSMDAFNARSIEEAGTPVCKAFISAKAPTAFETLLEPDSPPQFHAWFDATTYSTATVPATEQYKVFYHIYAGKDQGGYYNIYLKSPPQSASYVTAERVMVDSGYIERGGYASETRDFTAPEGYKELCVRINDDEECGFKQVSTSFAVNYLRDSWVSDELANKDVTSESECISGNPSLGSMANPNVMAGAEETLMPSIYDRGVVRICSTANPGLKTSPSRFVDVGYCDDMKIRCWLDKNSVDNALTDANIGVKNATLSGLEGMTDEQLEAQGFMKEDEVNAEIYSLNAALLRLGNSLNVVADAQIILDRINNIVWNMLWFNSHKAQVLLIKGQVKAVVAEKLFAKEAKSASSSGTTGTSSGTIIGTALSGPEYDEQGRVKVVLPSGSYGLSTDWTLNWWNGNDWFDIDGDVALDSWKKQLKEELTVWRANNPQWSSGTSTTTPKSSDSTALKCEDCDTLFTSCDYEKCHSYGDCYYLGGLLFGKNCVSKESACGKVKICADYSAEECLNNVCGISSGCEIRGGVCVEKAGSAASGGGATGGEQIKYYKKNENLNGLNVEMIWYGSERTRIYIVNKDVRLAPKPGNIPMTLGKIDESKKIVMTYDEESLMRLDSEGYEFAEAIDGMNYNDLAFAEKAAVSEPEKFDTTGKYYLKKENLNGLDVEMIWYGNIRTRIHVVDKEVLLWNLYNRGLSTLGEINAENKIVMTYSKEALKQLDSEAYGFAEKIDGIDYGILPIVDENGNVISTGEVDKTTEINK